MTAPDAVAQAAAPDRAGELRLNVNPLRLVLSGGLWRAAGYLICYLAVSWVLLSVALTAAAVAACLAVTLLAIPLLIAAAQAVHWCARVERTMLRQVTAERARTSYAQPAAGGLIARAKAAWTDAATWRELGYLAGLWVPLYALDTIVVSVWLSLLAGVTLPAWYWAPRGSEMAGYVHGPQLQHGVPIGYFPHGATGPGGIGLFVDSLPKALLAAAVFAVLFAAFSYVLVATTRMHARVAGALLGLPADPLRDARDVLTRPGPLGQLIDH
jgi:hypothetical protein